MKQCPYFTEAIQDAAMVCRYCGRDLAGVSSPKPLHETSTTLQDPSCESVLETPDHIGLVQCDYCGAALTSQPRVMQMGENNIESYLVLSNASLEGKNYGEALQYADQVLEIEPENINAWINKAIATFWFSTEARSCFEEALGYLAEAEELSPDDARIIQAKHDLTQLQANWLVHLGQKEISRANEEYTQILSGGSGDCLDVMINMTEAKTIKLEHLVAAFHCFRDADSLMPNNVNILMGFEDLAKSDQPFGQSGLISQKIQVLNILRAKPGCEKKLTQLRQELEQTKKVFADLQKRHSLFDIFKLDKAKDKIENLTQEIADCEKIITYPN